MEQRLKAIQELLNTGKANLRAQLRRLINRIKVDPAKGFAVFFQTGEQRLLTLKDGLALDAFPDKQAKKRKLIMHIE